LAATPLSTQPLESQTANLTENQKSFKMSNLQNVSLINYQDPPPPWLHLLIPLVAMATRQHIQWNQQDLVVDS